MTQVEQPRRLDEAPGRLFTAQSLAGRLALAVSTVYGYADEGFLPPIDFFAGKRFRQSEVVEWLEGFRHCPWPDSKPLTHVPQLLTPQEVADLLGIASKTVYKYKKEGRLPYVKIRRNIRLIESDVVEALERFEGRAA